MGTEQDHISLANHNHDLLLHLLAQGGFPDWAATVAFYKAVHVVEAVLATDQHYHSVSHTNREERLKTSKFRLIARDYAHLLTASRIARYLEHSERGAFHTFTDFLDLDGVKKLVKKATLRRGAEFRALSHFHGAVDLEKNRSSRSVVSWH